MAEPDDDRLVLASSRLPLIRDSGYNACRQSKGKNKTFIFFQADTSMNKLKCEQTPSLTCSVLLLEVELNESGG